LQSCVGFRHSSYLWQSDFIFRPFFLLHFFLLLDKTFDEFNRLIQSGIFTDGA